MPEGRLTLRVCIATGTRAEYHLLRPLIEALRADNAFDVRVVATGAHLSIEHGMTRTFIEADGVVLDAEIPILDNDDSACGIDRAFSAAATGFGEYFKRRETDLVVILGDRYEMLAIAFAALNHGVPIAHIHGGESTEGAIDESIRHAITKMSTLHFTSCEDYRRRVIQLGESPERVFNVGALGVENIRTQKLMDAQELEESIGFSFTPKTALVTYHPTTLADAGVRDEVRELLDALATVDGLRVLFTRANADAGGQAINRAIEAFAANRPDDMVVSSLGLVRYLSALSVVDVVVGNSSSGLLETAPFGVPVVNIGDRQKGRIRAENVIDCETSAKAIRAAIEQALSPEFKMQAAHAVNPFGDGRASERIVAAIKRAACQGISRKKKFFDMPV